MAFTYDKDDPSSSKDQVRMLIRDVDTVTAANQIFTDGEINQFIALNGSDVFQSSASALRSMAADASKCDILYRVLGDITVDRKSVSKGLLAAADKFEKQGIMLPGFHLEELSIRIDPATGIDQTEYEQTENDEDDFYYFPSFQTEGDV